MVTWVMSLMMLETAGVVDVLQLRVDDLLG